MKPWGEKKKPPKHRFPVMRQRVHTPLASSQPLTYAYSAGGTQAVYVISFSCGCVQH